MKRLLLSRTVVLCAALLYCLAGLSITQAQVGFSRRSSNSVVTRPQFYTF